jgi:hypothetical protein
MMWVMLLVHKGFEAYKAFRGLQDYKEHWVQQELPELRGIKVPQEFKEIKVLLELVVQGLREPRVFKEQLVHLVLLAQVLLAHLVQQAQTDLQVLRAIQEMLVLLVPQAPLDSKVLPVFKVLLAWELLVLPVKQVLLAQYLH